MGGGGGGGGGGAHLHPGGRGEGVHFHPGGQGEGAHLYPGGRGEGVHRDQESAGPPSQSCHSGHLCPLVDLVHLYLVVLHDIVQR